MKEGKSEEKKALVVGWVECKVCVVVHFGSVVSVGMGEAHGWCDEQLVAHTSINGSNFEVVFW